MKHIISIIFLLILSIVFSGDALFTSLQPAHMDGVVHLTNMAIFKEALKDGDFPVRWTDDFANYGLPMGSFAQQITSYLGALLTFLTNNLNVSYNVVLLSGAFFSLLLLYLTLKIYTDNLSALAGSIVFNFSSYRIINAHIRGALPEFFSSVFLIGLLYATSLLFKKRSTLAFLLLIFFFSGLILTHPMMVVPGLTILIPWTCFLYFESIKTSTRKRASTNLLLLFLGLLLGQALSAYYSLPLLQGIKYFYYGQQSNHLGPETHLGLVELINPTWHYFYPSNNSVLSRGHVIKFGLVESGILALGFVLLFMRKRFLRKKTLYLLITINAIALIMLFLVSGHSVGLYQKIDFLSSIQFQWRMLSALIVVPPFIVAIYLNSLHKIPRQILFILISIGFTLISAQQLYGKNFQFLSQETYYKTIQNLHSNNMNTVWTGETSAYPPNQPQVEIIEGEGEVLQQEISNSSRKYILQAHTPVRMLDKTFYFPGWKVYAGDREIPIEFQDPSYRGVITYQLESGKHNITVVFESTKTILISNAITLVTLISLPLVCMFLIKKGLLSTTDNKALPRE